MNNQDHWKYVTWNLELLILYFQISLRWFKGYFHWIIELSTKTNIVWNNVSFFRIWWLFWPSFSCHKRCNMVSMKHALSLLGFCWLIFALPSHFVIEFLLKYWFKLVYFFLFLVLFSNFLQPFATHCLLNPLYCISPTKILPLKQFVI